MLHNRTTDVASRAASIADREAETVWAITGDYQTWLATWRSVYRRSLKELSFSLLVKN